MKATDRIKRRKWAKERLSWTDQDWAKVIFLDESNFEVFNRKGKVFVRRFANQKYLNKMCVPRLQGGGGSVGIWGCFSFEGTGVNSIYTGRINQEVYQNVLENCLKPSIELLQANTEDWIFQQDNAPAHTAHSIRSYFDENNITVMSWPARSPDLNPIENIWAIIDRKMSAYNITGVEHLKQCLHQEWLDISKGLCQKLISSMKSRVKACYKAKGGYFKY